MSKQKTLKYEQAIEQLEALIEGIETGEIGLEESLEAYEKGMKLLTHCRGILNKAQIRIAELTADAEGKLQVKDDPAEDAD